MKETKYRFVFDANVLVSGLLTPKGHSRQALTKADRNGFILQSSETFAELEQVIYRARFDKYLTDEERKQFLRDLLAKSIHVSITESITECRDPKDDKYLELAVSGEADYIVSGDQDLLIMHPFRDIPILRPAEFLAIDLQTPRRP